MCSSQSLSAFQAYEGVIRGNSVVLKGDLLQTASDEKHRKSLSEGLTVSAGMVSDSGHCCCERGITAWVHVIASLSVLRNRNSFVADSGSFQQKAAGLKPQLLPDYSGIFHQAYLYSLLLRLSNFSEGKRLGVWHRLTHLWHQVRVLKFSHMLVTV